MSRKALKDIDFFFVSLLFVQCVIFNQSLESMVQLVTRDVWKAFLLNFTWLSLVSLRFSELAVAMVANLGGVSWFNCFFDTVIWLSEIKIDSMKKELQLIELVSLADDYD